MPLLVGIVLSCVPLRVNHPSLTLSCLIPKSFMTMMPVGLSSLVSSLIQLSLRVKVMSSIGMGCVLKSNMPAS